MQFKKYCEPILHLAGYSVTIFKTNYVGHAKSFIEKLNQLPDTIVVAGGQGTSSEVVTGLLRRKEVPCPILLLPLGSKEKSEIYNLSPIFKGKLEYVKILTNAAISLVENKTHLENVIRYDVIDADNNAKPIYGLHRFSWGLLKDITAIRDKYWYFGILRDHAAVFFSAFSSDMNSGFGANFVFTPPCPGCKNCVENDAVKKRSFLQGLVTSQSKANIVNKINILNENCSKKVHGHVETSQVYITCTKNKEACYEMEAKFIDKLLLGINLLKQGKQIIDDAMDGSLVLRSRTLELYPCDPLPQNSSYAIDGEEYATRPIKLSLIQNAIRLYN